MSRLKKRTVVDVRITDMGLVPPAIFLEPEVRYAVENVIRRQVVTDGQKSIKGVVIEKGDMVAPLAVSARWKIFTARTRTAFHNRAPELLMIYVAALTVFVALTFWEAL